MMGLSVGEGTSMIGEDSNLNTVAALLSAIADPQTAQKRLAELKILFEAVTAKSREAAEALDAAKKTNDSIAKERDYIDQRYQEVKTIQGNINKSQIDLDQREKALLQRLDFASAKELSVAKNQKALDEQNAALKFASDAHALTVKNFEVDREKRVAERMAELDAIHQKLLTDLALREKEASNKMNSAQKLLEDSTSLKAEYDKKLSTLRSLL